MGLRKPADFSELPKNLKPEIAERVAEHFKDGVFEFDFSTEEMIAVEGNTVYHVIPPLCGGRGGKRYGQAAPYHGGKFGGNRMKVAEKRGTARYNIGNRLPGCYPDTREERSYYEPAAR